MQNKALETSGNPLASCMYRNTQMKSLKCTKGRRWRRKAAGVLLLPVPPGVAPWRPRLRPSPGIAANSRETLMGIIS